MAEHVASRVRARNRLSATKVAKAREPGLYEDGAGLRLVVADKGSKRWSLRVTIDGRRVERGLGIWPTVSLDDARREAEEFRRAARVGRDARQDRRNLRLNTICFQEAFTEFYAIRRQHLTNGKHAKQWEATMRDYVFPGIGDRPVAEITASEVISLLKPIWFAKPETARRVLQRLKAVFDSAILRGTRERANPCIGVAVELGTDHRRVKHHSALPWQEVPTFVVSLRQNSATRVTKLALEFLILTCSRSGEARGTLWQEIDMERRLWTIPGCDPISGRSTKSRETHVVPLSNRCIEILLEARGLGHERVVFPGTKGQTLSDNTLSKLMRDAGIAGTPHGFRSAFKDWAAETGVRDEVSEAALAHADQNAVRAAYRRTRFLDERIRLMQRWADFVCARMAGAAHVGECNGNHHASTSVPR